MEKWWNRALTTFWCLKEEPIIIWWTIKLLMNLRNVTVNPPDKLYIHTIIPSKIFWRKKNCKFSRFFNHWKPKTNQQTRLISKKIVKIKTTITKNLASDESEPSWLELLELKDFQLGSWPFPFSSKSKIGQKRAENVILFFD